MEGKGVMEKAVVAFYRWWLVRYDNALIVLRPVKFAKEVFLAGVKHNDYAYESVDEYEEYFGGKVNEAFRIGWSMARVTNKMLGIKEEPLKRDVFSAILRDCELFCNLEVDQIFFECKARAFTLGNVLKACRRFNMGLDDAAITDLTRRFIDA
jgi:hypothetical protein